MHTQIITTERLILRNAVPEDFDSLFADVFSDAVVMKYLSGVAYSRAEAAAFFNKEFDHEGTGRKIGVLVERRTGDAVGYAGLKRFNALSDDDFEVGFVLRRSAWGLGYATEIGKAQLEYGFRTTGRDRLLAQVRASNTGSANALEKIGMSLLREYERPGMGTWEIYVRHRGE